MQEECITQHTADRYKQADVRQEAIRESEKRMGKYLINPLELTNFD
jgi:hypothetical protein